MEISMIMNLNLVLEKTMLRKPEVLKATKWPLNT
jgi:hypothetical protein